MECFEKGARDSLIAHGVSVEAAVELATGFNWGPYQVTVLKLLLDKDGVSVEVAVELTKYSYHFYQIDALKLLLDKDGVSVEAAVDFAKSFNLSPNQVDALKFLLDKDGVSVEVAVELAKGLHHSHKFDALKLLLDKDGVSVEAAVDFAKGFNWQANQVDALKILLDKDGVSVEAAVDFAKGFDNSPQVEVSKLLLENGVAVEVAVELAKGFYYFHKVEVLKLLLENGVAVEAAVDFAKGFDNNQVEALKLLLDKDGVSVEAAVDFAKGFKLSDNQVEALKLLLDKYGVSVEVAVELATGFYQSYEVGALKILLDKDGVSLEAAVELAKGFKNHSQIEILKLLLDKDGVSLEAAVDFAKHYNSESRFKVLERLLNDGVDFETADSTIKNDNLFRVLDSLISKAIDFDIKKIYELWGNYDFMSDKSFMNFNIDADYIRRYGQYADFDTRLKQEGIRDFEALKKKKSKDFIKFHDEKEGKLKKEIPLIEHVVYLFRDDNAKMADYLVDKITKNSEILRGEDSSWKLFFWTNSENNIPESILKLPNIEIKNIDLFSDHKLYNNLSKLVMKSGDGRYYKALLTQASDVVRVMAVERFGGVYHDCDYLIRDAKALMKYMQKDLILGLESGSDNSDIGNAFLASSVEHPMIKLTSELMCRNLNDKEAPAYVRWPINRFDEIMFTTGPSLITAAYFKFITGTDNDNSILLPSRIIYNANWARAQISQGQTCTHKGDVDTCFELDGQEVCSVGGDLFCGTWGQDNGFFDNLGNGMALLGISLEGGPCIPYCN